MISRSAILFVLFVATFPLSQSANAQEQELTFFERAALKLEILKSENVTLVREALISGVKYGKQAAADEAKGDELAHERAAYEWGYEVGDPKLVKMIRFFWEGVQMGVFGFGDYQENTNGKASQWATLESMVGGNGKEYTVDQAYVNDIFHDVGVATGGAERAQAGLNPDFNAFIKHKLSQ